MEPKAAFARRQMIRTPLELNHTSRVLVREQVPKVDRDWYLLVPLLTILFPAWTGPLGASRSLSGPFFLLRTRFLGCQRRQRRHQPHHRL